MGYPKTVLAAFLILFWATQAAAVEHPGALPRAAECSSCHTKKLTGKSVHSVMSANCNVCHVTMTRGDMTTITLSMPKEKICSACHDEVAALRLHSPSVKGPCLDCHEAHSSDYKALLRVPDIAETADLRKK